MKEEIKKIIYTHAQKGGMCENLEEGQIIGIKTGVELDTIAGEIEALFNKSKQYVVNKC